MAEKLLKFRSGSGSVFRQKIKVTVFEKVGSVSARECLIFFVPFTREYSNFKRHPATYHIMNSVWCGIYHQIESPPKSDSMTYNVLKLKIEVL